MAWLGGVPPAGACKPAEPEPAGVALLADVCTLRRRSEVCCNDGCLAPKREVSLDAPAPSRRSRAPVRPNPIDGARKAPCVSNRDQPSGFLATTRALSAGCSRGVRRLRRGGLARAEACLARRHIVLPFPPRSPEAEKMCIAMHGALPRFDPGKGKTFEMHSGRP